MAPRRSKRHNPVRQLHQPSVTDSRPLLILLPVLLLFLPGLAPAEDEAGKRENMYLSGAEVRPAAPVTGDLVVAAGRTAIDHYVQGDAVLAAGSVDIRGSIGEDLRVAGGVINVAGKVGGETLIGGGSVTFGKGSELRGLAWIGAHDATIGGRFGSTLTVYARRIVVSARVVGDVRLVGETIEVLPDARIEGKLTYKSGKEIEVHPGATVGAVVREPGTFPRFELPGAILFRPLLILGLLAVGALLLRLFPRFTTSALQTVDAAPLKSLGLGTAIFFSVPPVALLLVITIIGIPIALAAAALYAVALLVGYLVAASFLGDALLKAARKQASAGSWLRIAALAVALIVLWLVWNVPYAGPLLIALVTIVGLGAMVLQAFSNYSSNDSKPPLPDSGRGLG